jgi:hypothetical protein
MVRSGRSPVITATDRLVMGDGPDIYATVQRYRLRSYWLITAGQYGTVLAHGRTWTRGGAWVKAIAAAHRPGTTGGAS